MEREDDQKKLENKVVNARDVGDGQNIFGLFLTVRLPPPLHDKIKPTDFNWSIKVDLEKISFKGMYS